MSTESREELQSFLRLYPPYKDMGAFALEALVAALKPVTVPDGAFILTPNDMPPDLYIIESGKVQVRQVGDVMLIDPPLYDLDAGQSFPLAATAARRPAINVYSAVGEVKCWRLASADFAALLLSSCEFNRFVLDHVAGLLHEARRQIEIQFGQRNNDQQMMNSQLTAFLRVNAVRVTPSTPIREAMETMVKVKVGSVIMADADDRPVGIFTQSDSLRRVVVSNHDQSAPISEVMTAPPATISSHATAYDAMLAMAMHRIRHLVILDSDDRIGGVVSERDLFAMQRIGLRNVRKVIEGAKSIEELARAAGDVRRLCINMLAQGVNAEKLTQFISGLNDSLTRRVIEVVMGGFDLDGSEWAWLAFGSEGRDEQTFSTDQDNGIIFRVPRDGNAEALRKRFLAFAKAVNDGLARCGFPLCKGNIMASNPSWCLSQDEWRDCFAKWIRSPEPEALLNATIFFDFRTVYGSDEFARELRHWLLGQTADASLFLRFMAENAIKVAPPLGRIRDFVFDSKEFPHTIDLKAYGARLFVDAARIISLAHGVAQSSTVERLRQAAASGKLGNEDVNAMVEGFFFIQQLRLRNQRAGTAPGGENRVDPDKLNELDRQVLKEAFKQAKRLQSRLQLEYRL